MPSTVLIGVTILVLLLGYVGFAAAGYAPGTGYARGLLRAPAIVLSPFARLFTGAGPGVVPTRALAVIVMGIGAIAGVGLMLALRSNLATGGGSSSPIIEGALSVATNGWSLVIVALFFARTFLWGLRKSLIRTSSNETAYDYETVARLAEESRSTDDTNRVIVLDIDGLDDIQARIRAAFEGAHEVYHPHYTPDGERVVSDGGDDPGKTGVPTSTPEATTEEDGDDTNLPVSVAATDADPPVASDTPEPPTPSRGEVSDTQADTDTGLAQNGDSVPDESAVAETDELSLWDRLRLARMDLGTAITTTGLVWRFGVPALFAFAALTIIAQLWVAPAMYAVFAVVAAAVGATVYTFSAWRRRSRLSYYRSDHDFATADQVSALVKTVESPEMTVHMGFMGGRQYASRDREQLTDTLARRALQRVHGETPDPAIEERYAWCLRRYIPNLEGWRENVEEPQIEDKLISTVANSHDGMLTKGALAHAVVEDDRRYIWRPLAIVGLSRFVGLGHDPCVVGEVYEDLVPEGLVEEDVVVGTPGGDDRKVTVVHLRTEPLAREMAELRSEFASRIQSRAIETTYDMPPTSMSNADGPLHWMNRGDIIDEGEKPELPPGRESTADSI